MYILILLKQKICFNEIRRDRFFALTSYFIRDRKSAYTYMSRLKFISWNYLLSHTFIVAPFSGMPIRLSCWFYYQSQFIELCFMTEWPVNYMLIICCVNLWQCPLKNNWKVLQTLCSWFLNYIKYIPKAFLCE